MELFNATYDGASLQASPDVLVCLQTHNLFRCDYKNDCPDKSDESNCEVVKNHYNINNIFLQTRFYHWNKKLLGSPPVAEYSHKICQNIYKIFTDLVV